SPDSRAVARSSTLSAHLCDEIADLLGRLGNDTFDAVSDDEHALYERLRDWAQARAGARDDDGSDDRGPETDEDAASPSTDHIFEKSHDTPSFAAVVRDPAAHIAHASFATTPRKRNGRWSATASPGIRSGHSHIEPVILRRHAVTARAGNGEKV